MKKEQKEVSIGLSKFSMTEATFLVARNFGGSRILPGPAQYYEKAKSPITIDYLGSRYYLNIEGGKIHTVTERNTGRAVVVYTNSPVKYSPNIFSKIYTDLKTVIAKHGVDTLEELKIKYSMHSISPSILTVL
jgi:hypothetical protein